MSRQAQRTTCTAFQAQQEAAMRGPNAGYVEFTHSARHGRESLLALLIPHAVVNRDVTLYIGEQRRWLSPPDIDCTAWAIAGDERCVLMHQSFEFARIDPDAVDIALLAPVFPAELTDAEAEEAEREAEERRVAAVKLAQELAPQPLSGLAGTGVKHPSSSSAAFRDAALRGTKTATTNGDGDGPSRDRPKEAAVDFSVTTGRRVRCPAPTSLEVHTGSPDELYALLEYFPRLTSLRLHDGAQMDIGEIAEYLSETLTSLDIRGWDDHDYYSDYSTCYATRENPACFMTLHSALGLTNLRVLKLSCPRDAGDDIAPVLRGLPTLEELVMEACVDEATQALLVQVLAEIPRLRTLELEAFDIGSPEFRHAAPQLKRLETLKLTHAVVTPSTAYDWLELLPSLRWLEVTPHPYRAYRFDMTSLFDLDLPPSVFVVAPASSSRLLDRLDRLGECPPDATLDLTLPSFPIQDLCGPSALYTPTVAVNEAAEAEALADYCAITDPASSNPALLEKPTPATTSALDGPTERTAVTLPADAIRSVTALLPAPLAVPWALQITRLSITCATAPTRPQFRSLVECRNVKHLSLTNPPSEHDALFVMAGMPLLETFDSDFEYQHRIRQVQRMHSSEPLKDLLLRLAVGEDGTPYARAVARLLLSDAALITPPPPAVGRDCDDEEALMPAPLVPGQYPAGPPSAAPTGRTNATVTTKKESRHAAAVAARGVARTPSKAPSADPQLPPQPPCSDGLPLFPSLRSLSVRGMTIKFSLAVACRAPCLDRIVAASVSDAWIRDVVGSCPRLTSLEAHDCAHVASSQYRLLRYLPLDTIRLHRTTMGDEVKAELTDSMMWLRELDLLYLRRPRRY